MPEESDDCPRPRRRRRAGQRQAAGSAALGRIFRRRHRDERRRGAGDLRQGGMRHRAARRDDAGHGRLRGLPPPQGQSADAPHPGGDGDGARPSLRPGARARRRRRRFPDQAGVRHRADRARALAGPAEDDDRRAAHARAHLEGNRHPGRRERGDRRRRPPRPRVGRSTTARRPPSGIAGMLDGRAHRRHRGASRARRCSTPPRATTTC